MCGVLLACADNSASATAAAAAAAAASGRGRRLLVSSWGQDHGDGHDSNDSKWRSNTDTLPDFSAAALGGELSPFFPVIARALESCCGVDCMFCFLKHLWQGLNVDVNEFLDGTPL